MKKLVTLLLFLFGCVPTHHSSDYALTGGTIVSKELNTTFNRLTITIRNCIEDGHCYQTTWFATKHDYYTHEIGSYYGDNPPRIVLKEDTKTRDRFCYVASIILFVAMAGLVLFFGIRRIRDYIRVRQNKKRNALPKAKVT